MASLTLNSELLDAVIKGKGEFHTRFSTSCRSFRAGELLVNTDSLGNAFYRLRSGWACQFHNFPDGTTAIVDIYLPGDIIGLDGVLNAAPTQNVVGLTSISVNSIDGADGLYGLIEHRCMALYIMWIQSQRQQRADRLLATISSLDARGRIAVMLLDFYTRLYNERAISEPTYHLPLTQTQIGSYLGLTLTHVNRVLKSLREKQIVSLEKHWVTIIDLDQLTKLAQNRENRDFELKRLLTDIGSAFIPARASQMDRFALTGD